MSIAPVERPVASATYGFVRFTGGGLAPFAAGKLVEHYNPHVLFVVGVGTVLLAAVLLSTAHRAVTRADEGAIAQPELEDPDRIEREAGLPVGAVVGNVS